MLTGESIPYKYDQGLFGRVTPSCDFGHSGGGALELVARISHIDLNDGTINGRRLTDYTLGCNWYWNAKTKIQLNWIRSQLNDTVLGDSSASAFAVRAQIDF